MQKQSVFKIYLDLSSQSSLGAEPLLKLIKVFFFCFRQMWKDLSLSEVVQTLPACHKNHYYCSDYACIVVLWYPLTVILIPINLCGCRQCEWFHSKTSLPKIKGCSRDTSRRYVFCTILQILGRHHSLPLTVMSLFRSADNEKTPLCSMGRLALVLR